MCDACSEGASEGDGMERVILFFLIGLLAYLVYLVLAPFLVPLAWAAILVVFAFPLHRRVQRRIAGPSRAALATTLLVALILVAPVLLLTAVGTRQAIGVAQWFQEEWKQGRQPVLEWVRGKPLDLAAGWLPARTQPEQIEAYLQGKLQEWAGAVLGQTVRMAGVVGSALMNLFVMFFATFYLFRDGPRALHLLRQALPLAEDHRERLLAITHNTIQASLFSTFVVAAVQGALGGLMFAILGIGRPVLWGLIMAFFSLIPVLGAAIVWVPAAVIFLINGQWVKAVVLLAVGSVVIGSADNVLRPFLISGRAEMNGLLVFISALGGVVVFGFLGIVLGPMLVALGSAVLETYAARPEATT